MAEDLCTQVTTALDRVRAGDTDAPNRLAGLVYDELRRIAAGLMKRERGSHTLQPTALVNEAFLRLVDAKTLEKAPNRAYFFAAAARAMRQVLVDHARQRGAQKRGGTRDRVPLDEVVEALEQGQRLDLLALHDALDSLGKLNARQAQVVELRFFGGHTMEEIAEQFGISLSTIESDFRKASAFLRGVLSPP